ncbi:D-2-hydroxyacid dehydrogenase family protein [Actinomycetospora endophytica]|uniref:D-2-hydroxyacid dehydrogenase family protein n=1 Tax=Actinomycetospora endophytica TaxID=2291215 RepID=A0ABS8P7Y4_9PSEU|nr:D-2-hydroxyacid dehydrogenase family protein [Actinomycetospora endophytica]MCD2194113.1 D-2-hydroxyacid dehydrogenase family protein [Actinomycetospora endophytica]
MPEVRNVAILDDYQRVARTSADWGRLAAGVTTFHHHLGGPHDVVAALEPFDVLVVMRERTALPAEVLERLPNLRLLVTTGPANAAIDVAAAHRLGVTVCGTGGVLDNAATVEMTWALVLATLRHVPEEDRRLRDGGWQETVGGDLKGHRLGVVGLGGIGRPVAAVGQAFGMDVAAWSRHLDPDDARAVGVTPVSKDELFTTADVVTIHMKLSRGSRGLVGREDLERMGPHAILVNTSRGPIVDEDALLAVLHAGSIGGAGLDVYGAEPLPVDSPWRSAPRTVLTPHLGYVTGRTLSTMYADAVEDIEAFVAGSPVRELAVPPAP